MEANNNGCWTILLSIITAGTVTLSIPLIGGLEYEIPLASLSENSSGTDKTPISITVPEPQSPAPEPQSPAPEPQSPVLPSKNTLDESTATAVIEKWLTSKSKIYGPNYDIQTAESIATGDLIADIRDPSPETGSISWLKNNNAYFEYGNQEIKKIWEFHPGDGIAEILAFVYEERVFIKDGKKEANNPTPKTFRYNLAFQDQAWKIAKYCVCKNDECTVCDPPYDE